MLEVLTLATSYTLHMLLSQAPDHKLVAPVDFSSRPLKHSLLIAVDFASRPLKHLLLIAVDLLPHALEPSLLGHVHAPDVDEGQRHLPLVPECVRLLVEPATSELVLRRPSPKPNRNQRASHSCGSRHAVISSVNCQISICLVIIAHSKFLHCQNARDKSPASHHCQGT